MTHLTLDWLHIAALLGAIQGVFLAGVLATKHRNRTANRLLAIAMLAFSIYMGSAVYHAAGLVPFFPHFFGVAFPMPMLYGPLIYLYAVAASDGTRRLRLRDGLHFLPFAAVVLVGLPTYLQSGAEKIALHTAMQRGAVPRLFQIIDLLKLVSGVTYATATLLFLRRHRDRVKASYSSLERVNLQWLLWLAGAAAAIWMLAVVFELSEQAHRPLPARGDDLIALAIAVLVYAIGYMALRQPEIFRFEAGEEHTPAPDMAAPRYERSGLGDREASNLKEALLAAMDAERPWLESGLTLADLASRLSTTPHKLSEVLNSQLGQTYYDFVNGYRVREVQRRLASPEGGNLTLLALALDAGFTSKSTFNLVFKKHTGRTPSDYRRTAGQ